MTLFQLKMKVLVFDNIVFVMAPKINPAPAILTKSHIHYLLTKTSFANDNSSESFAAVNTIIPWNKKYTKTIYKDFY